MKKEISNGYSCEYCSRYFLAKINLLGHVINQHKKCHVCQNIFPSKKKVLKAHKRSVHKKVQLKHAIERKPGFKKYNNMKYTSKRAEHYRPNCNAGKMTTKLKENI